MTARSSWKAVERRICRRLGGERTPLSGEASRHTSADCIRTPEYVEVKMQPDPTAHQHLAELHEKARRYGRHALILYDAVDGPNWAALWLDTYIQGYRRQDSCDAIGAWPFAKADRASIVTRHEVGKRLPHRALVEDTVEKASEEGRPALVVLQKKGSPRQVALVPLEVPA